MKSLFEIELESGMLLGLIYPLTTLIFTIENNPQQDYGFKPILYDLKDLTEEGFENISTSLKDLENTRDLISRGLIHRLANWKVDKLIQSHFNVFELTTGEFINVKDLEVNPYK